MPFGTGRYHFTGHCDCEQSKKHYQEYKEKEELFRKQFTEHARREQISQLLKDSSIPKRWETRTFEHFEVTSENKSAYITSKSYADGFEPKEGQGLLFTGTVGTGKTHLSAAIALNLIGEGYRTIFGTVTTLLNRIRGAYGNEKKNDIDEFNKLIRCDLLIIDDLGKEKVTEWVDQTIYEIINTRYENNKSLIITTNLTLPDLENRYPNSGDAIVSRILEMCHGVKMNGTDWRMKSMK